MAQLHKLWPKMIVIYNTSIKEVNLSKISISNAENLSTNVYPKFTQMHSEPFPRSEAG